MLPTEHILMENGLAIMNVKNFLMDLSPFCITVHPESATSGYSKAPLNLPHLLLIRLHARFSSPSMRKFLRTLFHYSGRLPINQEVKILKTCELLINIGTFSAYMK